MAAQTYNPSYSGDRDWKDCGSEPIRAKFLETPSQPMAGYGGVCLSSQLHRESTNKRIVVQAGQSIK
jgi:hypothetical protein